MAESLKEKTFVGVLWSAIERFSVQGVQFLVVLVIARILDPKDFGLIGMLTIFLAVAQSLIDSGFSQALIRKQNRTEVDNSTVFYFNIVVSLLLYGVLYAVAPWVARFYEEPQLAELMRVLCIIVVVNSFAVVQRAIFTSSINFKTQAKASFISALISGCVGIYLAKVGYGVWTLVYQQLLNAAINTLLLWIYSSWRPIFVYSWQSFRELFAFGSKLMASGLIDTIYSNLFGLIVGKVFSATSLGFYAQAERFAKLPSANITNILQRVTYPVLCTIQDDDEKLRSNYRKLLRLSGLIVFPLMCLLAGLAYPLVDVLLGKKWEYTAALLIPICFNMMFYPIAAINLNLLQVKGRSDLFLKLEIIKKIIGVVVLVCSIPFGLLFMCYSTVLSGVIMLYVNTYYTKKIIGVDFWMQLKDLSIILLFSFLVFIECMFVSNNIGNSWLQLVIGLFLALVICCVAIKYCKIPEMSHIKSYIS